MMGGPNDKFGKRPRDPVNGRDPDWNAEIQKVVFDLCTYSIGEFVIKKALEGVIHFWLSISVQRRFHQTS